MTPAPMVEPRPPEEVMQLPRMGSAFQTRLSFMPQLLRRMKRETWRFERLRFDVDEGGFGTSVWAAHGPERSYSLVAFTRDIAPDQRTDRVIAEVWDATFTLFDGIPSAADIDRLRKNVPLQEGGRCTASELVLARANKSLRLFEHVADALAGGQQPDWGMIAQVGYLMRTTAVYGSGKFGCADRGLIADRPELAAPFQAEMLAVYLIRWMTIELVNHVARVRGGAGASVLEPERARYLGIGNSTGLGMAPFIVKYPGLINNWVAARETALARVRALPMATSDQMAGFAALVDRAARHADEWHVADNVQSARIAALRADLADLADYCAEAETDAQSGAGFWDRVFAHAQAQYSPEGQELTLSLLLEQHGDEIDDLAQTMSAPDAPGIDGAMTIAALRELIARHYDWALGTDFSTPEAQKRFWYYSEDKLEPRLGERAAEPGADLEMPLAIGREVAALDRVLAGRAADENVADLLLDHPEYRQILRRVQAAPRQPYGEIQGNLLADGVRPLDLLRFKLAFFGVSKFDPKSDLWTRVTMYQGAPLPQELAEWDGATWAFPTVPGGEATA